MKKFNFLLIIVIQLIFTSCAVTHTIKEHARPENLTRLPAEQKFLNIDVKNTKSSDSRMERASDLRAEYAYAGAMISELSSWDEFDLIYFRPSKLEMMKHPKLYNDDYKLKVLMNESVIKHENWWNKVLRVVTFGLWPQKITKKVKFEYHFENVKTRKKFKYDESLLVDFNLFQFFLIIPFNLDNIPIFREKEAETYFKVTRPTFQKVFERNEK